MIKNYLPILFILLLALALRTYWLTGIPPGLTHDEANHGREAIGILDGVWLFYFPLNYGSEPLYNYVVAANMFLLGEGLFALRLVNVFFGLAVIAATYLWARRVFDRPTALIASTLLAVSFWPLATSRQALRAGLLPALTVGAVFFFWLLVEQARTGSASRRRQWPSVAGFALCLAATLHTYLAARVLWLIFPIFLLYTALFHRALFRRLWRPALAGLAGAALLVTPMFVYLRLHPEAETRLEMLDRPVQALLAGNFNPLLTNASHALLAFFRQGYGDHFLAYNIPGRPVLDLMTAAFFIAGCFICLWWWRRPAYAFLLIWFGVGVLPSLFTGPEANTTRNLGALAVTYLLPAVGFTALLHQSMERLTAWPPRSIRPAAVALLILWLSTVAVTSVRDYFVRWGEAPDVRAAYQHTLIEALSYLRQASSNSPVVISSIYPGAAHDPSIALIVLPENAMELRWVDARYALVFPGNEPARVILPASTPLHPAFADLVQPVEMFTLRPGDLDPAFTLARLHSSNEVTTAASVNFGDAVTLLASRWLVSPVRPGDTAELLTLWLVTDPDRVGPIVPPTFTTEAVIFSHVLDTSGQIVAQRDSLDAPSWSWQAGDVVAQVHQFFIPLEIAPGSYDTVVGIYDRVSGERLPVIDSQQGVVDTRAFVVSLTVVDE